MIHKLNNKQILTMRKYDRSGGRDGGGGVTITKYNVVWMKEF